MARLKKITIQGYRSVGEAEIIFPDNAPLVLIGENNAGKSNIIRAIDLICGEFWPGNYEPQDNEFYQRDRSNPIFIQAEFSESLGRFSDVHWLYATGADPQREYAGTDGFGAQRYPKGEERDELVAVTIGADRRLSYQLGYSSKYTTLSKLMQKFHQAMLRTGDVRQRLEQKFAETKAIFEEVAEFGAFRQSLREDFTGLISTMTHRLDVDFEAYNPANFFHALRLQANEGGEPRTLEELGTGEEQMLAIAFAHAYARAFHGGILLAVEEPEAHLHPLAQEWLAKKVGLMAGDGLQVALTTHSPAFVDFLNIDGLALVTKDAEHGTRVIQKDRTSIVEWSIARGVPRERTSADTIQEFYNANATNEIKEGFFAKRIVLVEGPTEALALPVYLEGVGLDCSANGVAIVPVGGKGSLAKWWRLFTAYGLPVYVIFDNDTTEDREGTKRQDILQTLGEVNLAGALRLADLQIRDNYAVFGSNFERCLRALFANYAELEAAARDFLKSDSKPLLARHVARELARNVEAGGAGWDRFRRLAEAIRQVAVHGG